MKLLKPILTTFFVISIVMTNAQISKPSLSPRIITNQQVGMVNIKLDYGQPNKQNRPIFGKLIPFKKIWRTGANSATKISFDKEVKLAGNTIPAGTYGLYTIPDKNEWTIIIHKNSTLWGAEGYEPINDLIRFKVPTRNVADVTETLRIYFENFNANGGDLIISWEKTNVKIPLFVDSDELIFKEIAQKTSNTNKTISAQTYFDAAQFYYLKKKRFSHCYVMV